MKIKFLTDKAQRKLVQVVEDEKRNLYSGYEVKDLLKECGEFCQAEFCSEDGRIAVSGEELFSFEKVFLVDRKNGSRICQEDRYRLIIVGDKSKRRWMKNIEELEIRTSRTFCLAGGYGENYYSGWCEKKRENNNSSRNCKRTEAEKLSNRYGENG